MFALRPGQAVYFGIILGAVGPGIVSRTPGGADRVPLDVGQAIAYVVGQREVSPGGPARGLDKAGAAGRDRNDGNLVAVVVERSFEQYSGRQRAGQLDDRGVRRVAEVGADGRIVVALPLGSRLDGVHRVMDVVTEDLPLVVEVVIDAEEIFTHRDRQMAAGRGVGTVRIGRRRKILGGVKEQGVGIQQVAWNRIAWERFTHRQAIGRELCDQSRIGDCGHDDRRCGVVGWDREVECRRRGD